MDFEAYLIKKKIDTQSFQNLNSQLWIEMKQLFETIGYLNFDQRKKYFINQWRLQFPIK